jgi:hypothetical protein
MTKGNVKRGEGEYVRASKRKRMMEEEKGG